MCLQVLDKVGIFYSITKFYICRIVLQVNVSSSILQGVISSAYTLENFQLFLFSCSLVSISFLHWYSLLFVNMHRGESGCCFWCNVIWTTYTQGKFCRVQFWGLTQLNLQVVLYVYNYNPRLCNLHRFKGPFCIDFTKYFASKLHEFVMELAKLYQTNGM